MSKDTLTASFPSFRLFGVVFMGSIVAAVYKYTQATSLTVPAKGQPTEQPQSFTVEA